MVQLRLLETEDREQFIKDNQYAFKYGAREEFGARDDHFEEDGEIISRKTIEDSIDGGTAYRIFDGSDKVGGIVLKVNGERGDLELLFTSPDIHGRGVGYAAWCEVEKMYPQVKVWETCTPDFEARNIHFYINSPGGSVTDGMAIYDTMQYVKCDVCTYCMGMAASMGAFLLSGGAKGKRMALPNAEIMIHQPLGGAQGQATEIEIAARHMARTKEKLTKILAENCGKTYEEMWDATERDNWLTADEALKFGIIDKVVTNRTEVE